MFDALGTTTTEDVRRAYEAKRTCDAVRARAGECADAARGAVERAFARGANAVASTNAATNATTNANRPRAGSASVLAPAVEERSVCENDEGKIPPAGGSAMSPSEERSVCENDDGKMPPSRMM